MQTAAKNYKSLEHVRGKLIFTVRKKCKKKNCNDQQQNKEKKKYKIKAWEKIVVFWARSVQKY